MINIGSSYIEQFVDAAYLLQFACASFCMVVTMHPREDGDARRYLRTVGLQSGFVFLLMLFCNFIFSVLAEHDWMLPGVGTWISYFIGILVVAKFFCRYSVKAKVVTASAVYSLAVISIALGEAFGREMEYYISWMDSLYVKIAANLLVVLIAIVISKHPVYIYDISGFTVNMNFGCAVVSSGIVILYDMVKIFLIKDGWNANYQLLLCSIFLAFYILNITNYRMAALLCKEQSDVLTLRTQVQLEQKAEEMMAISEHNLKELRKIRHDINNQYAYMKSLLGKGDYDTLSSYFVELTGTFADAVVPYVDCGNPVLNIILNMEFAKAKERGVTLDILAVVPKQLPFSDIDLCKMLTNLIDNAVEATEAEGHKEPVQVVLKISGQYFYASVKNRTNKSAKSRVEFAKSTKTDAENHGFGMEIIEQVAKKYQGFFHRKIVDGYFVADVVLLLKEEGV